jgi:membrane protein involved in colicin uptake
MAWTAEMRAKARETQRNRKIAEAAKRASLTQEPAPVVMPAVAYDDDPKGAVLVDEMEVSELPAPGMPDPFEAFLAAQDAETREILTDAELRVIYEVEAKRAADEKRAAAKKLVAARASRHARATAGLIPAEAVAAANLRDRMNQRVSWTVNMPEAGNSGTLIDVGMRIDGRLLVHGTQVEGTLAEYMSYREIEHRAHENERQFQGRSRMTRLAQTGMRFLQNEVRA